MDVTLQVVPVAARSEAQHHAILALCTRAYEEDFAPYFAQLTEGVHVLAYAEHTLASHAMWVTRWLQVGKGPLLQTAYVEAVATEPRFQNHGYATLVLRRLAQEIGAYDVGALSPSDEAFYTRLGWELWRGPLSVRTHNGTIPSPDEQAMILRLPNTPALDVNAPLSIEWRAGEEVW